jgi:hypothetical protein
MAGRLNGTDVVKFENQTDVLRMIAEVEIVATPHLQPADVIVYTPTGDGLGYGGDVRVESGLTVEAFVFDYDRLMIFRPDLPLSLCYLQGDASNLPLDISSSTAQGEKLLKSAKMQHAGPKQSGNMYIGELPSSWIDSPGNFILRVALNVSECASWQRNESIGFEMRFRVTKSSTGVYVALGVAAVCPRSLCCEDVPRFGCA